MNGKDLSGAKLLAKARKGVDAQVEALASEVDEVSRGDIVGPHSRLCYSLNSPGMWV